MQNSWKLQKSAYVYAFKKRKGFNIIFATNPEPPPPPHHVPLCLNPWMQLLAVCLRDWTLASISRPEGCVQYNGASQEFLVCVIFTPRKAYRQELYFTISNNAYVFCINILWQFYSISSPRYRTVQSVFHSTGKPAYG